MKINNVNTMVARQMHDDATPPLPLRKPPALGACPSYYTLTTVKFTYTDPASTDLALYAADYLGAAVPGKLAQGQAWVGMWQDCQEQESGSQEPLRCPPHALAPTAWHALSRRWTTCS